MEYTIQLPNVHRWTPRQEATSTVTWDPYRDCRQHHPCHEITFYSDYLKCLDVVEPYHLERVLRQFGGVQTIPPAPLDLVCWYTNITHLYIQNPTHRSGFDLRAQDSPSDVQDVECIDHALRIAHPIIEAGHDASVHEPDSGEGATQGPPQRLIAGSKLSASRTSIRLDSHD
ncbi:hypothetical protein TEA_015205 [Camellia sinensis var. sinensis]|uniref:Aminotransferase-like plant mobile domain-containing protein n=1 Tax=Camellia sinensis var. sinensis TaxID=542762 RepID=A0A4S4DC23_CAMSN|nr:hypothetical protein TEA_015205 [Camellia sinensis var. sinensis]